MKRKPHHEPDIPSGKRTVELPDSSYQPSKAELDELIRIDGTFDDLLWALNAPVRSRRVKPRK